LKLCYVQVIVLTILILTPLCFLIIISITRPLKATTIAAGALAAGNMDIKIKAAGKD
jgi:methyl-accepting chemotaxis protein